jgi:hypothetical protein
MKTKIIFFVFFLIIGLLCNFQAFSQRKSKALEDIKYEFFAEDSKTASEAIASMNGLIGQAIVINVKRDYIIVKEIYRNLKSDSMVYCGTLKFTTSGTLMDIICAEGKKSPCFFREWPVSPNLTKKERRKL